MRSKNQCSMCPAIHTKSRSWLRSSSTREPSDPLLRVVKFQVARIGISPSPLCVRVSLETLSPAGRDWRSFSFFTGSLARPRSRGRERGSSEPGRRGTFFFGGPSRRDVPTRGVLIEPSFAAGRNPLSPASAAGKTGTSFGPQFAFEFAFEFGLPSRAPPSHFRGPVASAGCSLADDVRPAV